MDQQLTPMTVDEQWNVLSVLEATYKVMRNLDAILPGLGTLFETSDKFAIEVAPHPHVPLFIRSEPIGDNLWYERFGFTRTITIMNTYVGVRQYIIFGNNGYPLHCHDGYFDSPIVERWGNTFHKYPGNKPDIHKLSEKLSRRMVSNYMLPVKAVNQMSGTSVDQALHIAH